MAGTVSNLSHTGRHYSPAIERLRIILMFFMCVNLLGFPTFIGGYVQTLCGFCAPAFFILSGYLVLRPSEHRSQRIVRSIKRTAIAFGALALFYLIVNIITYHMSALTILKAFISPVFWFRFLVLNVWPFRIGGGIWYVQALLYAYIIIYFLDKKKLLKYDIVIFAVLFVFTVVTGELAGIFRWHILGYEYLPGNFLTRALPYTLLGCYIHRKYDSFDKIERIWYFIGVFVGVVLMAGEMACLRFLGVNGYYGHLIGMCVTAVCACMLALKVKDKPGFENKLGMSWWHTNLIYYLCQPVSVLVARLIFLMGYNVAMDLERSIGIFTFVVCFFIAWFVAYLEIPLFPKKKKKQEKKS